MATFNDVSNEYFKNADEKKKALSDVMGKIQKIHGKESISVLDNKVNLDIPNIPSGLMSLDLAVGIGGIPKGRIIELYGDNSAGKTTLALNYIANAQRVGAIAAFVDAEHALDPKWAKKRGVVLEELLISQPDNGEEALEIVDNLVQTNQVGIIVVDSVAALVPRSELEKDMGESSMGRQALLMSQACRKLTGIVSKTGTIVIFLNQIRKNIGGYGNPNVTTGGEALKFYASLRFEMARKETLKKGEEAIGVKTRVKIVKNKVAPPFTECTFDLFFDDGYDFEGSIIEEAVKYSLIQKGGAWYTYKGEKFQGLNGVKTYLKANPSEIQTLRENILLKVKDKGVSSEEVVLTEDEKPKRQLKTASQILVEESKEEDET
jgi:recombination protein RecA